MHNGWVTTPDVSQQNYPTTFTTINSQHSSLKCNMPQFGLVRVSPILIDSNSTISAGKVKPKTKVNYPQFTSHRIFLNQIINREFWECPQTPRQTLTYNACFSVIGSFQLLNWILLCMLDCVTNQCGGEEKEGQNQWFDQQPPNSRGVLDYEFESKRNGPAFGKKRARSDLAAEKYVKWYLTSVFSQTFYSRGV